VRAWELVRFGKATRTSARRSVAHTSHDRELRRAAKAALKYPPMRFDDTQIETIAWAFGGAGYPIHACAIMPDHVHLVISRTGVRIEQMVRVLKQAATQRLRSAGLYERDESPWARKCWKVFLDASADVRRAIGYVEHNPIREGRPAQIWPFVTPHV